MSEEDNRPVEQNDNLANINETSIDTSNNMLSNVNEKEIKSSEIPPTNSNTIKEDISKVKIRTILAQRLKKFRPSFKKALPLILVALISFAAGIGADRLITRHKVNKVIKQAPNIQRRFQDNRNSNGPFNNKQDNNKNNFRNGKPGA